MRMVVAQRFARALEILHEADQRIDTLERHRVVEARAHAADRAVAFEVREARGARLASGTSCRARASASVNGTFIHERQLLPTGLRRSRTHRSRDRASRPWRDCARPCAASPPCFFSHLNTRPAMYQPNVGGVFSIEPSSAMAL